ncbi:MAG: hypothetical protein O2U61_04570, partial [Candidatus Bathyarchaeota archaeon]|nr:hypothetical protein [Candidatus Bathyarchaeota archaeon]
MKKHLGQSLIEVLIAMGLLVLNVSVITFLVLDVYLTDRIGREKMIATFLAKEGIEATKSVRDNNWNDLINGEHGLVLTGNQWMFQGTEEDISGYLHKGTRKIIVEEIDSAKKKITSEINWEL